MFVVRAPWNCRSSSQLSPGSGNLGTHPSSAAEQCLPRLSPAGGRGIAKRTPITKSLKSHGLVGSLFIKMGSNTDHLVKRVAYLLNVVKRVMLASWGPGSGAPCCVPAGAD